MEKHFNKKLVMTKEDGDNFENSTKCWIYDNAYIDCDVKVREIIIISLENIEALCIVLVTSTLN